MVGKGSVPEPPEIESGGGNDELMMMMALMPALMEASQGAPGLPELPAMPDVYKGGDIDWSTKSKQLASKMKADYQVKGARRKGRTDTILTSPLLDEEEAQTQQGSILTGQKALDSGITGTMVL